MVQIGVQVALLLAIGFETVAQDIDIVVQGAHVAAQGLDLVRQVEQTLIRHHPLYARQPRVEIIELDLHRVFFRVRRACRQIHDGETHQGHVEAAARHGA